MHALYLRIGVFGQHIIEKQCVCNSVITAKSVIFPERSYGPSLGTLCQHQAFSCCIVAINYFHTGLIPHINKEYPIPESCELIPDISVKLTPGCCYPQRFPVFSPPCAGAYYLPLPYILKLIITIWNDCRKGFYPNNSQALLFIPDYLHFYPFNVCKSYPI